MCQNKKTLFDERYFLQVQENYPEELTLDQMRIICKIAKRSAKYLLDHNIVPCENTGKKTRQYKIRRDDIIEYLKLCKEWGSQIPVGTLNGRIPNPLRKKAYVSSFSFHIKPGMELELGKYFQSLFEEYPDVLYMKDVLILTGVSKEAIRKRIKNGDIKVVCYGNKYFFPKQALLDFMLSPSYLSSYFTSKRFREILGGFLLCQQEKSSPSPIKKAVQEKPLPPTI